MEEKRKEEEERVGGRRSRRNTSTRMSSRSRWWRRRRKLCRGVNENDDAVAGQLSTSRWWAGRLYQQMIWQVDKVFAVKLFCGFIIVG